MSITDVLDQLEQSKKQAKCYEARIERLQQMGRDPSLIQQGIADVLRVMEQGSNPLWFMASPNQARQNS